MNWLILTTKNDINFFFPMPTARNPLINDFDIRTIIHLTNIENYKNKKAIFLYYDKAYFQFCDLIKTLSDSLYGSNAKPYQLELLLYAILDEEIPTELKSFTCLEIR